MDKETLTFHVVTVSDSASKGEREDISGEVVKRRIEERGYKVTGPTIVPDEVERIREIIHSLRNKVDVVITTGGTGLTTRDVTPEATLSVIDRRVQGIEYLMICVGSQKTPRAALSRGVIGIMGKTLVINLPGSPRAVEDYLPLILEIVPHAVEKINDDPTPCGEDHSSHSTKGD